MNPDVEIFSGIEEIISHYGGLADQLGSVGIGIGIKIFGILALLNFIWSGILWMLHKEDMAGIMGELIKKVFFIFLFYWLVAQYDTWFMPLKNSFNFVAQRMVQTQSSSQVVTTVSSGNNEQGSRLALKPGHIIGRGMELFSYIFMKGSNGPWFNQSALSMLLIIFGCLVFYVFVRVGIEMMLIIIGGNIILAGGTFLLGFAGHPVTIKYAERYLNAAVNIGIRFLFLVIIINAGDFITSSWVTRLGNSTYQTLFRDGVFISAGSLIFYYMSIHVPKMAVELLGNGLVFTGKGPEPRWVQGVPHEPGLVQGELRTNSALNNNSVIEARHTHNTVEAVSSAASGQVKSVNTLFGVEQ
ncbi:MAG: type IV secretion system protein [Candidatus Omnitrophica bacterium]|nr:type IV secretion system protein [Candidatus Omnitrophota bacterium]